MVFAKRLIVLWLLTLAWPAYAIDSIPPESGYVYTCLYSSQYTATATSYAAACSAVKDALPKTATSDIPPRLKTYTYTMQPCTLNPGQTTQGSCRVDYTYTCSYVSGGGACSSGNGQYLLTFTGAFQEYCGTGSSNIAGTGQPKVCACDQNYMPSSDKKSCQQYTCPPSGSYSGITQPDQKVGNAGDGLCTGGCGYTPSSWKVGQDGQIWATWPYKSTGSFCNGDKRPADNVDSGEKNSKNPAPIPCGQNQCPGTVNGNTVCVPCKGQQEQGPSSSASSPSGGASSPGSSTSTNECNGVTCTTTTTTRDGSGNTTGTTTTTQKQESFCAQNPQSSLCKPSSFGGACAATTCQGDAVACAMAAEQYRRNCQWFEDAEAVPLKQAGLDAMNGQSQPSDHPAQSPEAVPVSLSSAIDQSDAIGGGSCPTDVSVAITVPLVGVQNLNLALSKACEPLQVAGRLFVAISLLWAAVFVFRGVS